MFLTTLPVDFTGARLLFVGIVAIPGFGSTSVSVTVGPVSVLGVFTCSALVVLIAMAGVVAVDRFSFGGFGAVVVVTIVFLVVDGSQWSLHVHGWLFSTDNKPGQNGRNKTIKHNREIRCSGLWPIDKQSLI